MQAVVEVKGRVCARADEAPPHPRRSRTKSGCLAARNRVEQLERPAGPNARPRSGALPRMKRAYVDETENHGSAGKTTKIELLPANVVASIRAGESHCDSFACQMLPQWLGWLSAAFRNKNEGICSTFCCDKYPDEAYALRIVSRRPPARLLMKCGGLFSIGARQIRVSQRVVLRLSRRCSRDLSSMRRSSRRAASSLEKIGRRGRAASPPKRSRAPRRLARARAAVLGC